MAESLSVSASLPPVAAATVGDPPLAEARSSDGAALGTDGARVGSAAAAADGGGGGGRGRRPARRAERRGEARAGPRGRKRRRNLLLVLRTAGRASHPATINC